MTMSTNADRSEEQDLLDGQEDHAAAPEADLEHWRQQAAAFESKFLRALADYQNLQRRSLESEARARAGGVAAVTRALIPALDRFEAIVAAGGGDGESIRTGLQLVRDELRKALAANGVEPISPEVGDEFDPNREEAVMRQVAEGVPPNHIAAVFETGWRVGELVLRPAKVAVVPSEE
jgi:molecular chaperone GrpE